MNSFYRKKVECVMVTSIARQSVIIKCNQQKSVLLGNYEFYYLAGLMKKLFSLELSEELEPAEMFAVIQENLSNIKCENPQEEYLIKLVSVYKPLENYDEQMKELFRWGETEEHLWQVNI